MISQNQFKAEQNYKSAFVRPVLVSIHDVMPETLAEVSQLRDLCLAEGLTPITLLVVPGRQWETAQISLLREWADQGAELAGHGWHHSCQSIHGWKHRLHSQFLSRNVAEHLSLAPRIIVELLAKCRAWFVHQRLPVPRLYVPPAWALGRLSTRDILEQPFAMIETFSGVTHQSGNRRRLPLVGFEADSLLRAPVLKAFNACGRALWSSTRPLRIGMHPFDHKLRLRHDLKRLLSQEIKAISYSDLFADYT